MAHPLPVESPVLRMPRELAGDAAALEVLDAALDVLLHAIPSDCWCGVVLDPSTLLDTGGEHEHGYPAELMPRLLEIEHAENDVDNLRDLARSRTPAAVLSLSTAGRPDSSTRYREVLVPSGYGDELRVLLRDAEHVWGVLVLCRGKDLPHYTEAERDLAASLSGPAATALRRSMLLTGVDTGTVADAPGLIMVDGDGGIRSATPTAARWLEVLQENHRRRRDLPYAVQAVAAQARRAPDHTPVRARARTRSGQWVSLQAWQLGPTDDDAVTAVSVGPSEPGELAAIVLDAYGLTDRERQVTQQVMLGHSTTQIAAALHLSPWTVQDHLKSVFDKTGVRSRRELVADLFFRHYLPNHNAGVLSTDGRMTADRD